MKIAQFKDLALHYRIDGPENGAAVVFINALGTDLRVWDRVLPLLPQGLRVLRFDKRGHGLSSMPKGPYTMGALVRDAERLLTDLGFNEAVVIGLSIGGMIAQGLATKRLDLVRALVLSNTGAKIGTREMWLDRIADAQRGGIEALADATMGRWFTADFRAQADMLIWRNMMTRQPLEGYVGCCHAIAGTDFYTSTSALRLPALGIAGSEDGSTPPDLVRETIDLIPGAKFELVRKTGHLPCVEAPDVYARILTDFLTSVGHI